MAAISEFITQFPQNVASPSHSKYRCDSFNTSDLQVGLRVRDLARVRLSNFETAAFAELSFLFVADQ